MVTILTGRGADVFQQAIGGLRAISEKIDQDAVAAGRFTDAKKLATSWQARNLVRDG
jgi:hypothetical protein